MRPIDRVPFLAPPRPRNTSRWPPPTPLNLETALPIATPSALVAAAFHDRVRLPPPSLSVCASAAQRAPHALPDHAPLPHWLISRAHASPISAACAAAAACAQWRWRHRASQFCTCSTRARRACRQARESHGAAAAQRKGSCTRALQRARHAPGSVCAAGQAGQVHAARVSTRCPRGPALTPALPGPARQRTCFLVRPQYAARLACTSRVGMGFLMCICTHIRHALCLRGAASSGGVQRARCQYNASVVAAAAPAAPCRAVGGSAQAPAAGWATKQRQSSSRPARTRCAHTRCTSAAPAPPPLTAAAA